MASGSWKSGAKTKFLGWPNVSPWRSEHFDKTGEKLSISRRIGRSGKQLSNTYKAFIHIWLCPHKSLVRSQLLKSWPEIWCQDCQKIYLYSCATPTPLPPMPALTHFDPLIPTCKHSFRLLTPLNVIVWSNLHTGSQCSLFPCFPFPCLWRLESHGSYGTCVCNNSAHSQTR